MCLVNTRGDGNHWRSQDFVLRGPENQSSRGNGMGSRLGGLGERRKLPQRGPKKTDFGAF